MPYSGMILVCDLAGCYLHPTLPALPDIYNNGGSTMRKHRLLACVMVLAMALSMIPATALAAGSKTADATPDPISYDNGVTLGKTATGTGSTLSKNNETTVTLTVEAPAENNPVIVEFVLDATGSLQNYLQYQISASTDSASKLGDPLADYASAMINQLKGKNVYVDVTSFATEAISVSDTKLADNVTADDIASMTADTYTFAANHVGTNVQAGIHTGLANLKESADDLGIPTANRYLVLVTDGGSFFYYDASNQLIGNYNEAGDKPGSVSSTLAALRANSALADTTFEQAIVAAANAVDAISGANLITIGFPYYPEKLNLINLTDLAADFVSYAADRSVYQHAFSVSIESILNISAELNAAISGIAGTVTTVIPAGAIVTDVVGEDFNFVSVNTLRLTVDGKEYAATVDGNKVEFRENAGDSTPAYVVEYNAATDSFTWTFNVPVLTGQKLTLSYDLKLDGARSTSQGTYVLPTNETAYLTPDPDAQPTESFLFPEPSLSYTVSGSSNGGYTPPPLLNTEDHFAYIVGYPVDYYTGEKTDDQTKMPVKPQGQITRAEVATIFFRMLTDEARNEYWSQTSSYSDVSVNNWFNNAVCTLSNAGIISGYPDGSFHPNGKITRAEFATIASRFFDVTVSGADAFPDISGHWARQYINEAAAIGIVTGYEDGTFRPQKLITRAEAMTMVNRTLGRAPEKDHLLDDMLKWPDNMDTTQWYYAQVQEATNSHEYQMATASDGTEYEIWTELLPVRDWVAFEKAWSDANSAANPGEVVR